MFPIEPNSRRKSLETQAQDQIPIAFLPHHPPAGPLSHYLPTRFRALALFGRRPAERVVSSVLPASENLHRTGREQVQQNLLMMLQRAASPVWVGLAATTSFGASTILGSRIVKVEPRPGSLSTVMSPPII